MNTEKLIQTIWNDKKERVDSSPYALYVSIPSPDPDLGFITKLVLEEISNPKNAQALERWARGWDRTIICVKPGGGYGCSLGMVNDDKTKSFIPVSTTRKIDIVKYLDTMPEGVLGTIVINSEPTTVEAFLISYIHILNQLVWDLYRSKLEQSGTVPSPQIYLQAVEEVKEKGFALGFASEDGILTAKKLNSRVSVRLYGSNVNKDVSRVMGAILPPTEPDIAGDKFIDRFGCLDEESQAVSVEARKPSVPIVFGSVTFGKELHAGHLFLLATADLLRFGLGGQSLKIINNNTGPRAAGALVRLSQDLGLDLKTMARYLDNGQIEPDSIVEAYRSRVEKGMLFDEAFELLETGRFDIFASMAGRVGAKLVEAGFFAEIVAESQALGKSLEAVESVNPLWRNSGFMFSSQKGVKVIRKSGRLTATGKVLSSLAGLACESLGMGEYPYLVFVDGSGDALDAAQSYSQVQTLGKALQMPGAGIGFGGKIASGSKGEALTLSELLEGFNKLCPGGDLALAFRQFVLTRPATMLNKNMSEAFFYDFKDNESLLNALGESFGEALVFRNKIGNLISNLRLKVGDKTDTSQIDAKFFEFLPKKVDLLVNTSFNDVVLGMSKAKNLGVMDYENKLDGFDKLGYGLNRTVKNRPLVDSLIMEALILGKSGSTEITQFARERGLELPAVVFGNDFPVKNMILEAVLKQGYAGQEAIDTAKTYMSGSGSLAVRANPFLGNIKSVARLEERMVTLSSGDFELLEKMLNFCLRRLGYG